MKKLTQDENGKKQQKGRRVNLTPRLFCGLPI
jgi:hypothetical protein